MLSDYNDREKMHALLAEKGFKKKSAEELRKLEEEVAAAAAAGKKKGAAPAVPKGKATSVTIKRVAKDDKAAVADGQQQEQRKAKEVGNKDGDEEEDEGEDDDGEGDDDDAEGEGDDDEAGDDDTEGGDDDGAEGDDDGNNVDDVEDLKEVPPKKEERRTIGGGNEKNTQPKSKPSQQLRKSKAQSGRKNTKASASQRLVLVVSTLCIVCFALSRRFPILRILFGRFVGGGRHQHAR